LQTRLNRKIIILITFACRILVVGASIARLVYLGRTHHSSNPFFDSIPYHICTQLQQAVSVIVASAPGLKKFLDRTQSGLMNVSLGTHTGATFGQGDTYAMTDLSKKSRSSAKRSAKAGSASDHINSKSSGGSSAARNAAALFRPDHVNTETTITGGAQATPTRNLSQADIPELGSKGSVESMEDDRSDRMIISVKQDWDVASYEREH
jgi:hypothetical protein